MTGVSLKRMDRFWNPLRSCQEYLSRSMSSSNEVYLSNDDPLSSCPDGYLPALQLQHCAADGSSAFSIKFIVRLVISRSAPVRPPEIRQESTNNRVLI